MPDLNLYVLLRFDYDEPDALPLQITAFAPSNIPIWSNEIPIRKVQGQRRKFLPITLQNIEIGETGTYRIVVASAQDEGEVSFAIVANVSEGPPEGGTEKRGKWSADWGPDAPIRQ